MTHGVMLHGLLLVSLLDLGRGGLDVDLEKVIVEGISDH